ncbi:MAG: hypothetical protein ABIP77_09055 [Candidatus Limnocylindrales bacterium]
MSEILTESFCERCGTRYTFESAAPRAAKLKGIRVLSRGLKNFVMSDDTSIDEAMAAARSETDRDVTSQQLDAFHKTFNFCMSCRQYTCGNCWNETEGRCLTCAPHLGHDILAAPFPDLDPNRGFTVTNGANGSDGNGHAHVDGSDTLAWPSMDLDASIEADDDTASAEIEPIDAAARLAALGATASVSIEVDGTAETLTEAVPAEIAAGAGFAGNSVEVEADEMEAAALVEAEPATEVAAVTEVAGHPPEVDAYEPEGAAVVEASVQDASDQAAPDGARTDLATTDIAARTAAAAAQTTGLLRRYRPGQSLDAEIEAFELAQATAFEPEAAAAAEADAPAVEEAAAEPEADAPAFVAAEETTSVPIAHEDRVEQPTWRIVAPDGQSSGTPRTEAPGGSATTPAAPQWPAQPEWPTQGRPSAGLPFLGRPAQPTGTLESLWAESAREVAAAPDIAPTPMTLGGAPMRVTGGVQPCVSCGLSLSATARFCRRCGSSQG